MERKRTIILNHPKKYKRRDIGFGIRRSYKFSYAFHQWAEIGSAEKAIVRQSNWQNHINIKYIMKKLTGLDPVSKSGG